MSKDIRIAVGFFDHPKTVKLYRRCGPDGVICLQRLWAWAAQEKPSGDLTGMDSEDIEIAAKWAGEQGAFFSAISGKFLDVVDGSMVLHDWLENNPWAATSGDRSDKGRLSKMKKALPKVYELFVENGRNGISIEEYSQVTTAKDPLRFAQGLLGVPLSEPTSPSPSPSPSPSQKEEKALIEIDTQDEIPYHGIVAAYNKFCPSLPRVKELTKPRRAVIKTRWNKYKKHPGGFLSVLDELFKKAEASDFLCGRDGKGFGCGFDWLMNETNMVKVIEGNYQNKKGAQLVDNVQTHAEKELDEAYRRTLALHRGEQ